MPAKDCRNRDSINVLIMIYIIKILKYYYYHHSCESPIELGDIKKCPGKNSRVKHNLQRTARGTEHRCAFHMSMSQIIQVITF